jgi:hypothetical protein
MAGVIDIDKATTAGFFKRSGSKFFRYTYVANYDSFWPNYELSITNYVASVGNFRLLGTN